MEPKTNKPQETTKKKRIFVDRADMFTLTRMPISYQLTVHFGNLRERYSDEKLKSAFNGTCGNYILIAQIVNFQQYYGINTVNTFFKALIKGSLSTPEYGKEAEYLHSANGAGK